MNKQNAHPKSFPSRVSPAEAKARRDARHGLAIWYNHRPAEASAAAGRQFPRVQAYPRIAIDRGRHGRLTISRRLGHGSPTITLGVYGHLFSNTDDEAARIMERALGAISAE
jgi:integrase